MSIWGPRKGVGNTGAKSGHALRRTLSWPHLICLGVGAIVGTGIYTLIGVGAERAGPGVLLAFVIAGAVCVCAALAYAELATLIPASGSAYTYTYTVVGERPAWIVGWSLILEYTVVCSAVAVGWSGYAAGFLQSAGVHLPEALLVGPHSGGIVNLPAVLIVLAVAGLLLAGARESATINAVLVLVKIAALATFVVLAAPAIQADNFEPFMPYGFLAHTDAEGTTRGVMAAAAIIFFAFYGFDAVSTASEETINPGRDLTIGIVGSMIACTIIYMAVAGAALGAAPFQALAASSEPLAHVLRSLGHRGPAVLIGAAAVIALPTVILAFMYGQSRIFFAMARDGLLPTRLARVSASGTPTAVTIGTAAVVAVIAGLLPLSELAELANAGTLAAFVAVGACLLVLRVREPELPRVFRAPWPWVVGPLAIAGCLYLFASLPAGTQLRFFVWNIAGIAVYLLYSRRNSNLRTS